MACDENDGRAINAGQFPLEFETVDVRKLQVQDQARGRIGFFRFQELRSRPECDYSKSHRRDEAGESFANSIVVIHYEHDGAVRAHSIPLDVSGIVKQTVAPGPT